MLSSSVSKSRIDALTGLRFFAALTVYLSHHPQPSYLPGWLSVFFNAGYNGVTIFFVLSGFVIGLNYTQALSKPNWRVLLQYFAARFARIYPLYFLVLIFIWLTNGGARDPNFVLHLLAVQAWSPDIGIAYGYDAPGWSVGVEFFLYASFPFLIFILAPLKQRKVIMGALAVTVTLSLFLAALFFISTGRGSLPLTDPESAHRWLYRTPTTRLGDFALGIIAALLFADATVSARMQRLWAGIGLGAAIGIVALMLWTENLFSVFSLDVSYAPLTFLLILGFAFAPASALARLLASRLFVTLGEASFALYLVHVPLINIFGIERYLEYDPWVAICAWAAFGGACLIFSIALNVYVEKPIRHLINHWVGRLTDTQPSA